MRTVDAGAPELFVRFAAGGAQMKEDVALRDFLGFILIPDRPVGWGRRGGFGIAARGLVIRAVRLFDGPGLSVNRLFGGDVLCGCFGGVIDGKECRAPVAVLREREARFRQGAFYVLLEKLIGRVAVLFFR